jgi:hypothetical protein
MNPTEKDQQKPSKFFSNPKEETTSSIDHLITSHESIQSRNRTPFI